MRFNGWLSRVISVASCSIIFGSLSGCITPAMRYQSKPIVVQTVPFFTQKKVAPHPIPSWQGDWAFRRWRFEEINATFFEVKPDLLIAQEVMQRADSPYESDQAILTSSSLAGYTWSVAPVDKNMLTAEEESAAVAFSYPFQLRVGAPPPAIWKVGGGYLAGFILEFQQEPLAVFSWFQDQAGWSHNTFDPLLPLVQAFLQQNKICASHVLMGGVFAQGIYDPSYQNFLQALGLRDASEGFCEQETLCYTHTSANKMYKTLFGESIPKRGVRILVPKNAQVFRSERNFTEPGSIRSYNERYGLGETWATLYAGWVTEIQLPSCE